MGWSIRHDNGILVTDDFAEPAGHAFLRHDLGYLIVARASVRRVLLHINAVERADVHAELAAGTVVHDDLRLRDLAGLDASDEITVLILNAGDGAIDGAYPAIDAAFGVDDVQLLGLAADRVHRTLQLADGAANAGVCNEIRHDRFLLVDPTRCDHFEKNFTKNISSRAPKCNSFSKGKINGKNGMDDGYFSLFTR